MKLLGYRALCTIACYMNSSNRNAQHNTANALVLGVIRFRRLHGRVCVDWTLYLMPMGTCCMHCPDIGAKRYLVLFLVNLYIPFEAISSRCQDRRTLPCGTLIHQRRWAIVSFVEMKCELYPSVIRPFPLLTTCRIRWNPYVMNLLSVSSSVGGWRGFV